MLLQCRKRDYLLINSSMPAGRAQAHGPDRPRASAFPRLPKRISPWTRDRSEFCGPGRSGCRLLMLPDRWAIFARIRRNNSGEPTDKTRYACLRPGIGQFRQPFRRRCQTDCRRPEIAKRTVLTRPDFAPLSKPTPPSQSGVCSTQQLRLFRQRNTPQLSFVQFTALPRACHPGSAGIRSADGRSLGVDSAVFSIAAKAIRAAFATERR
jgi:hypothetical protein